MREGCGGRTLLCRGQRPAGCLRLGSVGRPRAAVFSFDTQTRGRYRAFYLSARESRGKKMHFTKFGLLWQLFGFQQRPAGKFCRIVSSVASSDCRELVAISPVHLQLAARCLPLDSVLRATEVVICIWDCLIRSLY